jgi:hypothetical protein
MGNCCSSPDPEMHPECRGSENGTNAGGEWADSARRGGAF